MLDRQTDRQTGRIEYIDIFRSFGIILMVMGHIGFGSVFDHFIHAFHMPMFFFVSGFLYKRQNIPFLSFLKKKAKSLLLPFFIFGILHFLYYSLLNGFSLVPIKALLLFPTNGLPIAGALWFLMALFFTDVIYYLLNTIKNGRILWIVVIMISLAGQILPSLFRLNLPFALGAAMVGVGLMHIGRVLRPFDQQIVDLRIYQILLFGALVVFSIMQSDYINMRTGKYSSAFVLFWVNAIAASIIGLNVAKRFKEYLKDSIVNRYLQSIGRSSIVYVCLNQIVIMLCGKLVNKALELINVSIGITVVVRILVLILSLMVLFFLSLLFEKTFFRVFIGRFNSKKLSMTP